MKPFQTIQVSEKPLAIVAKLNRAAKKNSINGIMIGELIEVLTNAEKMPGIKAVILEGEAGLFCTGMDFSEGRNEHSATPESYMGLLKKLSGCGVITIAKVDGTVAAGGVGVVAACDLVVSTVQSEFSLPEALWGLLPCCVIPYLIRRVGYQKAYAMSLTTQTITAEEAKRINLVDILTEETDDSIRKLMIRMGKIERETISTLKAYFRKMWILDNGMQETAVAEIEKLIADPMVRKRVSQYVSNQQMPWMTNENV